MDRKDLLEEYEKGKRYAVSFEGYVWRIISIDFNTHYVLVRTLKGDVWKPFKDIKTFRR